MFHRLKSPEIEPLLAEEARKRQATGGPGEYGGKPLKANVPEGVSKGQSRDQAAAAVGLSGKTVSAGKAIREADPVRWEKVKAGKLSVAKAKKEIKAEQDKRDLAAARKGTGRPRWSKTARLSIRRLRYTHEKREESRPSRVRTLTKSAPVHG